MGRIPDVNGLIMNVVHRLEANQRYFFGKRYKKALKSAADIHPTPFQELR
jgi:hypothetical protein